MVENTTNLWVENTTRLLNNHENGHATSEQNVSKIKGQKFNTSVYHQVLANRDLVQHLDQFFDITTLYAFSTTCTTFLSDTRKKLDIPINQIRAIFLPALKATNNNTTLQFLKCNQNSDYLYKENTHHCISGVEHPYRIPSECDKKCVKLKDIYPQKQDTYLYWLHAGKVDHALHYKMSSGAMELFHKLFPNDAISNYLKCLISFSNTRITNGFLYKCDVDFFINHYQKIQPATSDTINNIDKQLWQSLKITNHLGIMTVNETKTTSPMKVRTIPYFIHYFEIHFLFKTIFPLINWEKNFIAGGAVFQALVAITEDTLETKSDLDIFAYNITYSQWLSELNTFETKLIDAKLCAFKSVHAKKVQTYYIHSKKAVKIQFIFSCETATQAQILTSFDLSAVQVGFNPETCQLLFSYGFLDYIFSGQAIIFNLTQQRDILIQRQILLPRVIKYHKYGIKLWKIPQGFDLTIFEERLNVTIRKMKKRNPHQIGFNHLDIQTEADYSQRYFTNKKCLRSDNHDEAHILKKFLNLLLNENNSIKRK